MTVKSILEGKGRDVATIDPTATLDHAIKQLAERRIGALVVTGADHRLIGILSERDVVRTIASQGSHALKTPIADVMTRKVMTCVEDDTITSVMERMTSGKFRHLPVIDQGRLTGIVSIGDVGKSRVGEMERDAEALQDYIRTA